MLSGSEYRQEILRQIEAYLEGDMSKEEYSKIAGEYYEEYSQMCDIPEFNECFEEYIPDACLFYITEPADQETPEQREEQFRQCVEEAYEELQSLMR